MLFAATSINYVDRQIIGVLKPTLQGEFGWTESSYGDVVFWFQAAYALGYVGFGRAIDKIGARLGYAAVVALWTAAHVTHALVSSVGGFIAVRFALGLGESGNFPAGLKAIAEWFPKQERALATGIFVAGTNVGALATPLLVPMIVLAWGWPEAFVFTGIIGFIWLAFWLLIYKRPEEHKRLSKTELAYIQSDLPEPTAKIPWRRLFPHRQTWAFGIGKFLTDPAWWFYLYWLPKFLNTKFGLTLDKIGLPLVIVYLAADIGSIGGGWLSSFLIGRGADVRVAASNAVGEI